jgi:uroporphyrinogen decarboxylase
MTPREIVCEQIHHRETEHVPYTLVFEAEVEDRLDEHFGNSTWRDKITQYIIRTEKIAVPLANINLPRVKDVFGAVWKRDKLPPAVLEPALKSPSFENYTFPTVEKLLDQSAIDEATKLAANSDSFIAIAGGLCLWQTWYIRGFEQTMMDCAVEEEFYEELLEQMTLLTLDVIEKCEDIPADAIMLDDDWGGQRGVLIGPERWRRFFKPRYERIFDAIHQQNKFAILHCCGSPAEIMRDIIEIGLDVLESVQPEAAGMNPYELKKKWGDKITFWGGLGSQSTIPLGTPEAIRREVRKLNSEMSKGGGYILAPAKPLRPETPLENVLAVIDEFTS